LSPEGVQNLLQNLCEAEVRAAAPEMDRLEAQYRQLMMAAPTSVEVLVAYNQFRLRQGSRLAHRRPKVLLGFLNDSIFPNFHSIPLLKVADVVSLSTQPVESDRIDRLHYRPFEDRMPDILERLPDGFVPDLYWDNQVEHGHVIPRGLNEAPFPVAAGLCHVFLAPTLAHISRLFDLLAPVSRTFIPRLQSMAQGTVVDIPFGANWASFQALMSPKWEKTVDVALTFADPGPCAVYGDLRSRLLSAIEEFERKYGHRFKIVVASGLERRQYLMLLQESRIVLNAVSINGPYNYRTCEAMSAGALLFQYDGPGLAIESQIGDYFRPGEHLVTFTFEEFETKLLHFLEHRDAAESIARQGWAYVSREYSYESVYRRLFREIRGIDLGKRKRTSRQESDFELAMAYWHQPTDVTPRYATIGLPYILQQAPSLMFNNLMVLVPWFLTHASDRTILDRIGPDLSAVFSHGIWEGISDLYRRAPEHPVTQWNYAMLGLEHGRPDRDLLANVARRLASEDVAFDPTRMLVHAKAQPPGLTVAECRETWMRELSIPLLGCAGSEIEVRAIYRGFMEWHCRRALGNSVGSANVNNG
jgi:hypothetical protein